MNARLALAASLVLALTACSAPRLSPPAAASQARRPSAELRPGTLFVAVGDGALPGAVVFSAPPYTSRAETRPSQSPLGLALTADGALIVADEGDGAPLSIVRPPYDGVPKTIARFTWGGGMAIDKHGNLFLAQKREPRGASSYLEEYRAPDYMRAHRFGSATNRAITSVTALPDGGIAVGSILGLDVYHAPFTRSTKIALKFVAGAALVPGGLVVAVCPPCFRNAGSSYLALVTPPFVSSTMLTKLPNVAATSIASSAAGDVFVTASAMLYRYTPPYTKGRALPKTAGALDGVVAAGPNGDLFFGSTSQPGFGGSFTIFRLPAPYTENPQALFNTPGVPGSVMVSQ